MLLYVINQRGKRRQYRPRSIWNIRLIFSAFASVQVKRTKWKYSPNPNWKSAAIMSPAASCKSSSRLWFVLCPPRGFTLFIASHQNYKQQIERMVASIPAFTPRLGSSPVHTPADSRAEATSNIPWYHTKLAPTQTPFSSQFFEHQHQPSFKVRMLQLPALDSN